MSKSTKKVSRKRYYNKVKYESYHDSARSQTTIGDRIKVVRSGIPLLPSQAKELNKHFMFSGIKYEEVVSSNTDKSDVDAEEEVQPTEKELLSEEYKTLSGETKIPHNWGIPKLKTEIEKLRAS